MWYSMYRLIAGVLSEIFGIGEGMLLSWVLVQLGMLPKVVIATCGLFTSAVGFAVLWYEGHWIASYAMVLGIISILYGVYRYLVEVSKWNYKEIRETFYFCFYYVRCYIC